MRALCAISGLDFNTEHFPGFLANREVSHPIFSTPQRKLLAYSGKFYSSELTDTDKYLLFLAVLHSSDLVEWRTSIVRTPFTQGIIARNFESLVRAVSKVNTVSNPAVRFPNFVVTHHTANLSNVHHWIDTWHEAYKEFHSGTLKDYDNRKLGERERVLERLIKNPHKSIKDYANQIADWAIDAGDLRTVCRQLIPNPLTGKQTTCYEYWHSIIVRAARLDRIYAIPKVDIEEIIEYFESKLDVVGSIFSHQLLKLLRTAEARHKDFLGLDLGEGNYSFVDGETNVAATNMALLVSLAPTEEPQKKDYPGIVEYMRAKNRWRMAQSQQTQIKKAEGDSNDK